MSNDHGHSPVRAHGGIPVARARVVVGVDCSPESQRVLRKAAEVALRLDADLETVFVYMGAPEAGWLVPSPMADRELEGLMHNALADAVDEAFGPRHPARLSQWALDGDPATVLLARAKDASMLVVGSTSRGGLTNVLLGSVAAKCAEHASGPVLVVPPAKPHREDRSRSSDDNDDAASMSAGRIVVGVDGSASSMEALRWAWRFAALYGTGVDAVITWDPPPYFNGVGSMYLPVAWNPRSDSLDYLERTIDGVFGDERPDDLRLFAEEGAASRRLLAHAKDAALLVVGSRGHGGFHNLLLGSVSSKCANDSTCEVLVVHLASADGEGTPALAAPSTMQTVSEPGVHVARVG